MYTSRRTVEATGSQHSVPQTGTSIGNCLKDEEAQVAPTRPAVMHTHMHASQSHSSTHTLTCFPAASSCAAAVCAHSLLRRLFVLVSPLLTPLLATTWLLSVAGGGVKGQNIYNAVQRQMGPSRGGAAVCVCVCVLLVSACDLL